MPAKRTITSAARELQSAANRLALMTRNHNRDTILAGLFPDVTKGRAAAARLEAQRPAMDALEAEVAALRRELGGLLDQLVPLRADLAEVPDMTEPPTKKRKKK